MTNVVSPPDLRLIGRWRRTLLVGPDDHRDDTSTVLWLQAGSLFVDLRRPRAPESAPVEGFAGRLRADGRFTCWDRLIDLHPDSPPDEGLLEHLGTGLLETGRHVRYVEHWQRDDGGPWGSPLPSCAVELREVTTGSPAILVQVGDDIGWARALSGFDTEVALGSRMDDGVTLYASNLPGRAGEKLDLEWHRGSLLTVDLAPDGSAVRHRWQVVDLDGRFEDLPVQPAPECGPEARPAGTAVFRRP